MILMIGLREINHQTGGNVTEKITPETYHKMNKEFEEEGIAFRIIVPTQEKINNSIQKSQQEQEK